MYTSVARPKEKYIDHIQNPYNSIIFENAVKCDFSFGLATDYIPAFVPLPYNNW